MPDSVLRVAVAGAAHPHVEYALREVDERPELILVAVSDPSPGLAARYGAPRSAALFTDHRDMLESVKPDVVVVAGIYGDRAAAVVDALDAGCQVVADKPLCTTSADLEEIRSAGRRSRGAVALLLEKRDYPETVAALELVESGALGAIVEVNSTAPHRLNQDRRPGWFFEREGYGGILADLATHDVDLALRFTGAGSGTISGAVAGRLEGSPDFSLSGVAVVRARTQLMVLEANWLTPAMSSVHGDYHMRLVGTAGVADLWWARGVLTATTADRGTHDIELGESHRPAEHTFSALLSGQGPAVPEADAFLATRLALLAQESAESGGKPIPWTRDG